MIRNVSGSTAGRLQISFSKNAFLLNWTLVKTLACRCLVYWFEMESTLLSEFTSMTFAKPTV